MPRPPLLLAALLFLAVACAATPPGGTVLLISIDGLRHDDRARGVTPTLDRLAAEGARAERLRPVFPTLTFPNHYSLVTGLHPGRHGITGNSIHDPVFDATFSLGSDEITEGRWWGGEPVWVTAGRQGLASATLFWPGSEAEIRGRRPTYWLPYDHRMPHAERVDRVLAWLDLPEPERPRLITLYFSAVDSAGHDHGPGSPEQLAALADVDAALARLLAGLESRALLDAIDLLVVSDHGMTAVSPERVVYLDDHVDLEADAEHVLWGATTGIWPAPGRRDALLAALRAAPLEHARVLARGEFPEAWHYTGHRTIPPIVLVADEGWTLSTRDWLTPARKARFQAATHGYDPALPSMHGVFLARGPQLRPGAVVPELSAVDVYPLMVALLGIAPAEHQGSLAASAPLRRTPDD